MLLTSVAGIALSFPVPNFLACLLWLQSVRWNGRDLHESDVWVAVGSLVAAGAANAAELLDPLVRRITRAFKYVTYSLFIVHLGVV